jgi:hypothetical protein
MKTEQTIARKFWQTRNALLCLVLACMGCDTAEYSSTEGTVKLDGLPLANATVLFHAPQLAMATARTDNEGRYRIETGGTEGMRPGEYVVTVAAYRKNANGMPVPILLTPEQYLRTESSGLKASITRGVNRNIDFDLNSAVETSSEPIAEQFHRVMEVTN